VGVITLVYWSEKLIFEPESQPARLLSVAVLPSWPASIVFCFAPCCRLQIAHLSQSRVADLTGADTLRGRLSGSGIGLSPACHGIDPSPPSAGRHP